MDKREEVEAFINRAAISKPQKNGLITRLNGLTTKDQDLLEDRQIDMIFEGMPSLKELYLKDRDMKASNPR